MPNQIAIIIPSALVGLSILSVGGPVVGEMVATMAPIYTRRDAETLPDLGIPAEQVAFQTTDGLTLRGWFFPAETTDAPAIVYAPATSHDQRSGLSLVLPFHQAGYHVLLFSYRGHGNSEGNPFGFTYGVRESKDVDAAVNYLYDERGIRRIGAIGHSAGAVSVILSSARNIYISAVVAASPFNTIEEVWETNRPAFFPKPLYDLTMWLSELRKGFSRNQVRPLDAIGMIGPRPLLLVHGSNDQRITSKQVLQLFTLAKEPKQLWIIEGATHQQVRSPGLDELTNLLIQFFDEALQKPAVSQQG